MGGLKSKRLTKTNVRICGEDLRLANGLEKARVQNMSCTEASLAGSNKEGETGVVV